MPLRDVIAAAISRPAGRIVEGPVRTIVNEVLADHGYASPAEVAALREEAQGLQGQLSGFSARIAELEQATAALQSSLEGLQAQLLAATVAPAAQPQRSLVPDVPPPPATPIADRTAWVARAVEEGRCKVMDCEESRWRDGFCIAHASAWQTGQLAGFVSPEGLVSVDGQPRRVDPGLSGALYAVEDGTVRVHGDAIPAVAY